MSGVILGAIGVAMTVGGLSYERVLGLGQGRLAWQRKLTRR